MFLSHMGNKKDQKNNKGYCSVSDIFITCLHEIFIKPDENNALNRGMIYPIIIAEDYFT